MISNNNIDNNSHISLTQMAGFNKAVATTVKNKNQVKNFSKTKCNP